MYPNLRAEMARNKITGEMLAESLKINPATMSAKLNEPGRIKLTECNAIVEKFFPNKTIDELFRTDESKMG